MENGCGARRPNPMVGGPDGRSSTPLNLFSDAKGKINEIFREVFAYIDECHTWLNGIPPDSKMVDAEQVSKVGSFKNQINNIQAVLKRDQMKVVFFGRTSSGKSTVINAMLGDKVLPSGIGHTTDCFVSVEGCDGEEKYLIKPNSADRHNVTTVKQMAHALATDRDHGDCIQNQIVRIFWPKSRCDLLINNVTLVDSPGIDVEQDLDKWIDSHCMDADVFVLVSNAESTLMRTEKKFFHKVSDKLSKPNIFILNNRWDASASEPESMVEAVKRQHIEREVKFLVHELKVITKSQANDRIFFVSAKETLDDRISKTMRTPNAGPVVKGSQARLTEFENFERKFEECISQTAVETKFEQHAKEGKLIVDYTQGILSQVSETATTKRSQCIVEHERLKDKLDKLKHHKKFIEECINTCCEQVKSKASDIMTNEMKKLSIILDKFDEPFSLEPQNIEAYLKVLQKHLEAHLKQILEASSIRQLVKDVQREVKEKSIPLLAVNTNERMEGPLFEPNFGLSGLINSDFLFDQFKANIEFHFTFGLRFIMDCLPTTEDPDTFMKKLFEDLGMEMKPNSIQIIAINATTWVIILVAIIAVLGIWRKWPFVVIGGIGGMVYLAERKAWEMWGKKKMFLKQLLRHASNNHKVSVAHIASSLSQHIEQGLARTLARPSQQVENTMKSMDEKIVELELEKMKLDELIEKAKLMKEKPRSLEQRLESFLQQFVHH